ncbi:hypothetical protein Nepgr_017061 [Nepenthes gracilis]|uniref:Uncharacterized protein n=1 Tax=Nepenthes gracilis TaxID=150966 RepID=A0AAD3SQW9_NEPGR|nr:hypothetical protein Nepgr_017061 [Nepenthes gracilis]
MVAVQIGWLLSWMESRLLSWGANNFEGRASNLGLAQLALDANAHVSPRVMGLNSFIARYYFAIAKELMRISGTTKSLVVNHLAESVARVMTIRAFKKEFDDFQVAFHPHKELLLKSINQPASMFARHLHKLRGAHDFHYGRVQSMTTSALKHYIHIRGCQLDSVALGQIHISFSHAHQDGFQSHPSHRRASNFHISHVPALSKWKDGCVGTLSSSRSPPTFIYLECTKTSMRHGALGASVGMQISLCSYLIWASENYEFGLVLARVLVRICDARGYGARISLMRAKAFRSMLGSNLRRIQSKRLGAG